MHDKDQTLHLQQALTTSYDILGYDELLDYRQPPPGPLSADERAWIDEQLRHTGRRGAACRLIGCVTMKA